MGLSKTHKASNTGYLEAKSIATYATNETSEAISIVAYATNETSEAKSIAAYATNEISEAKSLARLSDGGGSDLQVEGDTTPSLSGSYIWLLNNISGLSDPHNIEIGDIVKLSYILSSQLWINCELTNSGADDFILIPIVGNTLDRIVDGQQFVVTGGIADGVTYQLTSTIYLNGTAIPGYHIVVISYVSGPIVTIPIYPIVDFTTSIDDPIGSSTTSLETQVTAQTLTTIDVKEYTATSVSVTDIDIYKHHYIKTGNFAIGKEVAEYPLDVEGKGRIENCITDGILTDFPANNDVTFDEGDLVFFGNDASSNIVKLSDEYTKTYDEDDVDFNNLADNMILNVIPMYGDEIGVTIANNGGLEIQAFKIDDEGTTVGTALSTGIALTSEVHIIPLNYTIGYDYEPETADNVFCIIELNTTTDTIWRGIYHVDDSLNITSIIAYSDTTVAIPTTRTLKQVVPLKSKVSNDPTGSKERQYVLIYQDSSSYISYFSFVSVNINTLAELFGIQNELPTSVDVDEKIFGHFRMSNVDLHLISGNNSGITHLKRQLLSADFSVISTSDSYHGESRNKLLYVDFRDTYIGTDDFDYRCVQISNEAVINISENTWDDALVSSANFTIKENCAYQHGTDYDRMIQLGNTQKVVAFNRGTSSIAIIDLKDKTIVPIFKIGAFPYSGSRKEIAFNDRFIAINSLSDYGLAKFFFNHFGMFSSGTTDTTSVIMRGLVPFPEATLKTGATYSLGSKVTEPTGSTSITLSDENSTGYILGTALSTTLFYLNPTLNSITGSENPLNEYFDTINDVIAATGSDEKIVYCRGNNTFYKYKAAHGPGEPIDSPYIIQGGGGFDTRWVAVAGQYTYEKKIETLLVYNGLVAAAINKDKVVTFSMPNPLSPDESTAGVAAYAGFGIPLGIAYGDIANESLGRIVTYGPFKLNNFDSTPASVGDPIYIDSSGNPSRSATSWILGTLLKPEDSQSIIFIDIKEV